MVMKVLCDTLNAISWVWSHYGAFQSQLGAPQSDVDKHHLLITHHGKDVFTVVMERRGTDIFISEVELFILYQTERKDVSNVNVTHNPTEEHVL